MTTTLEQPIEALEIQKEIEINAPIQVAFQAVLDEMGPENLMMDGRSLSMKLEPWPGGRWYRDLGNNTGHLWGHVQVIKPPTLLEIYGPMPMSFPAMNHLQYRLTSEGDRTRLRLTHKAMGQLPQELRDGMPEGWEFMIKRIREIAERRTSK
jgi:uncharacterized protein YndB with AHSA1/START domain